ncbi:hypothetical protein F2Q69_00038050 [Brassica cretica]|uniref:Uncharacterized protein n=1 Tax=Brassica cretica TaxID=69181 RepID=A0A8S9SR69_BRACR|nr:hypothetical protein F2Q69_00038050 [Brassica cretica]
MAATKMFFRSGFGYAGFSNLKDVWDDLHVSRLKYNALDDFEEVFQTTSRKSSRRLPGIPDDFQEFQTTSRKSSRRLFQEVVWTSRKSSRRLFQEVVWTSRKSSRRLFQEVVWTSRKSSGLPRSRLVESSPMPLPFITDLGVLVFNQMVLIFYSFKGFSDLKDFWDDLHVSCLKYNALDDFQEVFQTILGSLLTKFSSLSSGVQACLCR